MLYSRNANTSGNIIKHYLRTSVNERIHYFTKIKISHTLFTKGWCLLCVRDKWRQGWTAILARVLLWTIEALLRLGWVVQPWVTEGPKPSIYSWLSLRHPVSDCFKPPGHLVILFSYIHMLPLFFCLFTQMHLLIEVSVKGQYIMQE